MNGIPLCTTDNNTAQSVVSGAPYCTTLCNCVFDTSRTATPPTAQCQYHPCNDNVLGTMSSIITILISMIVMVVIITIMIIFSNMMMIVFIKLITMIMVIKRCG